MDLSRGDEIEIFARNFLPSKSLHTRARAKELSLAFDQHSSGDKMVSSQQLLPRLTCSQAENRENMIF